MSDSTLERELGEQARRRRAAEPELAKQARLKRAKKADGGVHDVKRAARSSRVQEAASAHDVERPLDRRWVRSAALPALKAPAGFAIKWTRRDNRNRGDNENLRQRLSEGWEYAKKSDFPSAILPTSRFADQGEVIGNDSTVLLKIDERLLAQRDRYYNTKRNRASRAVNDPKGDGLPDDVRHAAMPIVENKTENQSRLERTRKRNRIGGGTVHVAED